MSNKSKIRKMLARLELERRLQNPDVAQLEDAHNAYWWHRYEDAGKLIFDLSKRLIVEPHMDTEEYKNGERKLEETFSQQEETELFSEGEVFTDAPEAEYSRDEDGYLIR